jgi:hypothetical protein
MRTLPSFGLSLHMPVLHSQGHHHLYPSSELGIRDRKVQSRALATARNDMSAPPAINTASQTY